ncbi:hypothetical protein KY285_012246 [Solanum tuberosum]|nr:hypothetical protein KY289_011156 [Solanum tuberosum]KAH0736539.1 hypothetical protein KY285_012246 [Solanum tuberosum]
MQEIFPTEVANFIKEKIRPPREGNDTDKPTWMLASNGKFSVKSAWEYVRHKEQPSQILGEFEDGEWRDLRDAGVAPIPPKRLWPMCSGNQNLLTGPGLNIQQLNLRECIMQWWGANVRQGMQAYFKAITSIIIWELWRRRNARKHEELRTT